MSPIELGVIWYTPRSSNSLHHTKCTRLEQRSLSVHLNSCMQDQTYQCRRVPRSLCRDTTLLLASTSTTICSWQRRSQHHKQNAWASQDSSPSEYIDAALSVCEQRDTKGLYALARRGALREFTGIDSPYEAPETPELHLHTDCMALPGCIAEIRRFLDAG